MSIGMRAPFATPPRCGVDRVDLCMPHMYKSTRPPPAPAETPSPHSLTPSKMQFKQGGRHSARRAPAHARRPRFQRHPGRQICSATVSIPPRVSVFIPLHNGEPYLGAAIDSVLGQTLRELELVIVENGSADRSLQTARRAAARDPRVRIVEHARPLGIVGAGNAGVAAAIAPLVARQDQDDLSDPRRLERQVVTLERDRTAVAVGTLCDCIDETGRRVRPRDRWRLVGRSPLPPFPHGSLCVRRDVFTRVGGYRDGTHRWEDVDLLLRLEREGRILVLPEALYRYRYHERSLTSTAEPESDDESAALMWRCIEASRQGADWSELLASPPRGAPSADVAACATRHRDGMRLWTGAPLDDEGPAPTRLLRARRAWQRASPATLRAALFAGILARDRAAAAVVHRNRAVPWRPR